MRSSGLISTTYGVAGPWRIAKAYLAAPAVKISGSPGPTTITVDSLDNISSSDLLMFDDPTGPWIEVMGKGMSTFDPVTKIITLVGALNGTNDSNTGYTLPTGTPVGSNLGDLRMWSRICSDTLTWNRSKLGMFGGWNGKYVSVVAVSPWAISTSYVFGQFVTKSGNLYVCVKGGLSAGAGGPSGLGSSPITDNTVIWFYVSSATYSGSITIPMPETDGEWRIDAVLLGNDGVHIPASWICGRSAAGATYDYVSPINVVDPITQADSFYPWSSANRSIVAYAGGGNVQISSLAGGVSFGQIIWKISPIARTTLTPT
jgi:hypothetical protein